MKPVSFPQASRILHPPDAAYSANVEEVQSLEAWSDGEQCVSCWRPTWRERISILFFGRVWLSVLSGWTQPPVAVVATRKFFRGSE